MEPTALSVGEVQVLQTLLGLCLSLLHTRALAPSPFGRV